MKKAYMVFDGRARFDEDDASIMECMGEGYSYKSAIKYFRREYKDMDAVLFEYDLDGDNLINGHMVCL